MRDELRLAWAERGGRGARRDDSLARLAALVQYRSTVDRIKNATIALLAVRLPDSSLTRQRRERDWQTLKGIVNKNPGL
jgi:hypothetical protein